MESCTFRPVRAVLVLAVALAPAARGAAQGPPRTLDQHVLRRWADQPGLAGTIHDLARTPDGYLWIATGDGLLRFDGVRFVHHNSRTDSAWPSNEVLSLTVGAAGELWVGTAAGLLRGNGDDTFRAVPLPGLPRPQVMDLDFTGGTLWAALGGHGVLRMAGDSILLFGPEQGLGETHVRALAPARDGGVWVATAGGGVLRLRERKAVRPPALAALSGEYVHALIEADDGLWIATRGGLWRLSGERLQREPGELGTAYVIRLLLDDDGALWAGTAGEGLFRRAGGRTERLEAGGLAELDIRALIPDGDGGVFLGTVGDGLLALFPGSVTPFTRAEGMPHDIALAVLADADGGLWAGTYGGGLAHLRKNGEVVTYDRSHGLRDLVVLSLARTREGLWVGTRQGLLRLEGGQFQSVPDSLLTDRGVVSLHADRRGRLWIGTVRGLNVLEEGRIRGYTAAHGLSSEFVFAVLEARDGDIWVGTQGGGINRFRAGGGIDTIRTADGLGSDVVITLFEDRNGTMWAGTQTGLSRIGEDRIVTIGARHGLPDDQVYAIVEDDQGDLWMSTNHGIARVPWAHLEAVAQGRRERLEPLVLTSADGMPSTEANGGIQPAAARTSDGRLWFPTMKGLAAIDPAALGRLRGGTIPRIEEIRAAGEPLTAHAARALPPRTDYITLTYTAFDYRAPEAVRFRYRLVGYDDDWVDAGTERAAHFTNLPPQRYRFEVQARAPHGQWGSTAYREFALRPTFYQTRGFAIGMLLLFAGSAAGLHMLRTRALRIRERELLALIDERDSADRDREAAEEQLRQSQKMDAVGRLAGGIAHDFNNLLTTMFGQIDLLRERRAEDGDMETELSELRESADRAARLTRQLLAFSRKQGWSPGVVEIDALVQRALPLLRRTLTATLELRTEFHASDAWIRADVVQFEQILLNLVINARDATSAGGTITISTRSDTAAPHAPGQGAVILEVSDTGTGMDAATRDRLFEPFFTTKPPGEGTGLGLSTVYAILQRHEGQIEVDSEPGRGSTFRIRLPATAAPPPPEDAPDAIRTDVAGSERVLLAEDEAGVRALACRLLQRRGYQVVSAASGDEALEIWSREKGAFDLVITDLVMPGSGGRAVADRVRSDRPDVPILFMSGYSEDEAVARSLPPPADFLPKPFDLELLASRVRRLLDSRPVAGSCSTKL